MHVALGCLVPEFRAGATQILFENFAKFHPNFANFSLRSSLRGPGTQPENFAQKITNSSKSTEYQLQFFTNESEWLLETYPLAYVYTK